MSDTRIIKDRVPCVCLTCGNVTKPYVKMEGNDGAIPPRTGLCEKCSKTAPTMSLNGLWAFMDMVAKDLVSIKSDIFDIQCALEEQEVHRIAVAKEQAESQ